MFDISMWTNALESLIVQNEQRDKKTTTVKPNAVQHSSMCRVYSAQSPGLHVGSQGFCKLLVHIFMFTECVQYKHSQKMCHIMINHITCLWPECHIWRWRGWWWSYRQEGSTASDCFSTFVSLKPFGIFLTRDHNILRFVRVAPLDIFKEMSGQF